MLGAALMMSGIAFVLGILTGLAIRFAPIHDGIRTQADLAERNVKTSAMLRELSEKQRIFSEDLTRREEVIRKLEKAFGLEASPLDS